MTTTANTRSLWPAVIPGVLLLGGLMATPGCFNTPVTNTELDRGPVPLRGPSPEREEKAKLSYEDSLTGGQVFSMYCSYCHNAPALSERPFSNMTNVMNHMSIRANLTGKERAKVIEFLRRVDDCPPPPNPPPAPSPKRFIFKQPINELREEAPPAPLPLPAPQPLAPIAPPAIMLPVPDAK